jgi:hypothetical protein
MAVCPMCKGTKEVGGGTCAYCGGDGEVTEEARRQWLEYLLKEPLKNESIRKIFKPIKPEEEP